MSQILAAIDLGSHSTRLLVSQDGSKSLFRDMQVTRMGEKISSSSEFTPEALRRVSESLKFYTQKISELNPESVRVIATEAARKAKNIDALSKIVEELFSVELEVLSSKQEAELAFLGAASDLTHREGPFLTLDIGGASTEFALGSDRCEAAISLPMGSLTLTEEFIHSDPPLPEELYGCLSVVESYLMDLKRDIPEAGSAKMLVGMAGTVTTAAAVELGRYDPQETHHFELTKEAVEDVFRTLSTEDRIQRTSNPGLHPDRVEVIVAGLCILVKTMRFLGFESCLVSETDILDGAILDIV